jgi:regulator of sigma E protease
MTIITSVLGFLLAIGVLVFIHELGHYLVARKLGFKVESFSIGFGKPLLSFSRTVDNKKGVSPDKIDYRLSLLPLGGYVKILDGRNLSLDHKDYSRSFIAGSKWHRFLVLLAGPAFNLILATIIFFFLSMLSTQKPLSWISDVVIESPASKAGLVANEMITNVNGNDVDDIGYLSLLLIQEVTSAEFLRISTETLDGSNQDYSIDIRGMNKSLTEPGRLYDLLGIKFGAPISPVIGEVLPNSPAQTAGLLAGDRLLSFNGFPITNWSQWVSGIRANPNTMVSVDLMRSNLVLNIEVLIGSNLVDGNAIGVVGTAVDQETFNEALAVGYVYSRDDIYSAPVSAIGETYDMSLITLKMLYGMILGRVSLENISGPISIASFAGDTISYGARSFMRFLAIISISLGILNLLPIPMLDGGQILQLAIEQIKGSPLSDKALLFSQQIGMIAIVLMMTVAIFNDINRHILGYLF